MPQHRDHFTTQPLPGAYHRMTPRMDRLLSLIDSYRLMRSTHAIEFLKYYFNEDLSEQQIVRSLRWLTIEEKELIRIRHDPDAKTVAKGSLPKIYGKNIRRNQALNERRHTANLVVPHALEVVSTMAFNVVRACRESNGRIRFYDAPDILQNMALSQVKAGPKPFTWPIQVTYRDTTVNCSLTPDRLFATLFSGTPGAAFYALEEDRASEPQQRNDFSFASGTSLFRKLLCYVFAYHARVPEQRYNINGFRILFVTNSRDRIDHILPIWKRANDVLKEFQKQAQIEVRAVPNNVLLCVDRPTLRPSDIFSVPWTNGRGDQISLELQPSVTP
jgi:hypothetical protein